MSDVHVYDFVDEFAEALKAQLKEDEKRWGDTWLKRTRRGQSHRLVMSLNNYIDHFQNGGQPIPLLQVVGDVMINWVRDTHPEMWKE